MDAFISNRPIGTAAVNAITVMLAAALPAARVNCVDPGWVRTDMGGDVAPLSVEEGADTIVWLATLPPSGPTGGFFRDRRLVNPAAGPGRTAHRIPRTTPMRFRVGSTPDRSRAARACGGAAS